MSSPVGSSIWNSRKKRRNRSILIASVLYVAANLAIFATHWPYFFGKYEIAEGKINSGSVYWQDNCGGPGIGVGCHRINATFSYFVNGNLYQGSTESRRNIRIQSSELERLKKLIAVPNAKTSVYYVPSDPSQAQIVNPNYWGSQIHGFLVFSFGLALFIIIQMKRPL